MTAAQTRPPTAAGARSRRGVACRLAGLVVRVSAAAASPAGAAVCKPVTARFELKLVGGVRTRAQRVRTRHVACRTARRVLRACGRSPYAPNGWRGTRRRGTASGQLAFVLTSGPRRIYYRTAHDAQLPCANAVFARRPAGVARGPFVLSAHGLQTLTVGMRRRAAERSSGLDLRAYGLSCARSYVHRHIAVAFADDSADPAVAHIMVSGSSVPTTAGLRVGDPVARITELYGAQAPFIGDLDVGQGTDFLIAPPDILAYEYAIWTSDGNVTLIVAGRRGHTASDEYCA